MGDVVNLNRFRKRKAKAERSKRAEVNRRLHGRTKAERAREDLQKQQLTRAVDGARLERPVAEDWAAGDETEAGKAVAGQTAAEKKPAAPEPDAEGGDAS